jgi:hypothetical protein
MSIEELVVSFNDGEIEDNILPYFNDVLTFLKYATKNGFVMDLDLDQIPGNEIEECLPYIDELGLISRLNYAYVNEEIKNILLLYQLEKNPEQTLKYISDNLVTDVKPMNGGYYLYVKDREELADLFYSGSRREYGAHEYAKSMLGEDMWEPFWDTTDDVYKDVIEDLNDKNKSILAEYIIKNIGGQEFSLNDYNNGLFVNFSEEQGTERTFQITSENVMELIGDEKAMKEMLKGGLSDLKSELYSIHNNAYNTAYTDEIYNDMWGELSTFFEPKTWETETKQNSSGKQVYYEYLKINNFYQIIYDFLVENEEKTYNESFLEYYGSLVSVIKDLMDVDVYSWLDFRVSDYADWTLTKKYINELFPDYI